MIFFCETSIGKIGIEEKNEKITHLYFDTDPVPQDELLCETPLILKAFQQLQQYLKGELMQFALPLMPQGTDFMKNIWEKLGEVSYGKTASYKNIAIAIGSPNAARAVGYANNKNPIPIFIPCHRIIGSNGNLVGYRGGLEMKKKLLELEKNH